MCVVFDIFRNFFVIIYYTVKKTASCGVKLDLHVRYLRTLREYDRKKLTTPIAKPIIFFFFKGKVIELNPNDLNSKRFRYEYYYYIKLSYVICKFCSSKPYDLY